MRIEYNNFRSQLFIIWYHIQYIRASTSVQLYLPKTRYAQTINVVNIMHLASGQDRRHNGCSNAK